MLSIVVPAYNKAAQLPRLLDSILDDPGWGNNSVEVIIVDDCSTDNTAVIAERYLSRSSLVQYVSHELNKGVHEARNTGMRAAKGEWIGFIDGDDYFVEYGLTTILRSLPKVAKEKFDVCAFAYSTSDTHERTGYLGEGSYTIANLFDGRCVRKTKNCFALVTKKLVEDQDITWYYTNLDSYFFREAVFKSGNQSIRFIDLVVGIYDTSTSGSLSKSRKSSGHRMRHSEHKIKATIQFMQHMRNYFQIDRVAARKIMSCIYLDFLFADKKSSLLRLLKQHGCGAVGFRYKIGRFINRDLVAFFFPLLLRIRAWRNGFLAALDIFRGRTNGSIRIIEETAPDCLDKK